MSAKTTLRCAACSRRIRAGQPHVGLVDYATQQEISYHARPECQRRGAEQMTQMITTGRIYALRHYHVCQDEAPGIDCSGGCFSGDVVLGRN